MVFKYGSRRLRVFKYAALFAVGAAATKPSMYDMADHRLGAAVFAYNFPASVKTLRATRMHSSDCGTPQ